MLKNAARPGNLRQAIRGLVPALLFVIPSAGASDPTLECGGLGSQVEIGTCVGETESRVDAAIAFAYDLAAEAARDLDEITERETALPALEAGQAAWVSFRNAQCDFVGAMFGGGSGTGIAISACRVTLGRDRVDALLRLVR